MTSIFINGKRTTVSGLYTEFLDSPRRTFVPPELPNPAPPAPEPVILIEITVLDSLSELPIEGASVVVDGVEGTFTTDENGQVSIEVPTNGEYSVTASAVMYSTNTATATTGESTTLSLVQYGELTGTVTVDDPAVLCAGAHVWLDSGTFSTYADENGVYHLFAPDGSYAVRFTSEFYHGGTYTYGSYQGISAGQTSTLDLWASND